MVYSRHGDNECRYPGHPDLGLLLHHLYQGVDRGGVLLLHLLLEADQGDVQVLPLLDLLLLQVLQEGL